MSDNIKNNSTTVTKTELPKICTTGYANQHNCECEFCCYKPQKKPVIKRPGSPGFCTTGYANQNNCDCKYCKY